MSRNIRWGAGFVAMLIATSANAIVITLTDSFSGANVKADSDVAPISSFYFANATPETLGVSYNFDGPGPQVPAQVIGLTAPGSNRALDLVVFQAFPVNDDYHIDVRFLAGDEQAEFAAGSSDFGGPYDCAVGGSLSAAFGVATFSACIEETGSLQTIYVGERFVLRALLDFNEIDAPSLLALLTVGAVAFGLVRCRKPRGIALNIR